MTTRFPALSESRTLRLTTVTAMYVAQGIQYGLLVIAFPAYMAAQGVSAAAIGGFISALILPWTLKLVYAPFMERYGFLAMGRRRPWVIIGTLVGAAGYLGMALVPDPLANLGLLTGVMVTGSLFLALQDVSVDAMTIEVVPLDEQPQANAFMWGGKVLGTAGTAAAGGWLFNAVGVSATLMTAAGMTAAFALIPILLRERSGERLLPWTAGAASAAAQAGQLESWAEIGRSLRRVLFLPASLFVGLVSFALGANKGLLDALGPIFTVQELGWTDAAYSNMAAFAGLVGGVVGMVGGGLLVRWLGRARAIQAVFLALAALGLGMGMMPSLWASRLAVQGFFLVAVAGQTLGYIALFALCMALCWKPVAAAQFALYMAIGNFGLAGGAALFGLLEAVLTYPQVFFLLAGVALAAPVVLRWIDVGQHVARLELLDVEEGSRADAMRVSQPVE